MKFEKITLDDGDFIEKNYTDTIRIKLSNYEYLWSIYIGHDGHGKMPVIEGLSEEESDRRQQSGELLYTCLESLICVYEIANYKLEVNLNVTASYIAMLNSFISFQAHCGRIRDNFSKLGVLLLNDSRGVIVENLNDLYQKRNEVLHGKKIPMRIEDSLVILPEIKGKEESRNKWSELKNWDSPDLDVVFLSDYLSETVELLFTESNSIIGKLIASVKVLVSANGIEIIKPIVLSEMPCPSGVFTVPISGSVVTYSFKIH